MNPPETKKTWTVLDILNASTEHLKERSFESPRLQAEWLLARSLDCKRLDLYLEHDRPLTSREIAAFRALLIRRLRHEPLQYILGSAEFMGYPFLVRPGVLIPRPDTEILVETVFSQYRHPVFRNPVRLLDIGTGTGAIIVSLAKLLRKHHIPYEFFAMDVNPKATELASQNAALNGIEDIRFFTADVFDDAWIEPYQHFFSGIVSNPPYISEEEYGLLPEDIRRYEPKNALFAEQDGLRFYEHISRIARRLLDPQASHPVLFYEISYNQAAAVSDILLKNGFKNIEFVKDYQHIQRIVRAAI